MNNTFDWTRFGNLVRKDIMDIWHRFGVTMLILALMPLAVWIFWSIINNMTYISDINPFFRWGVMLSMSVLASILAPSSLYGSCNRPKEGVYFAMLPASKLEKYLSMLLMCIVVCPLMILVGGLVADTILTILPFGPYKEWVWNPVITLDPAQVDSDALLDILLSPSMWLMLFVSELICMSSTFIFTNTIFKKHKFWKTILWVWIISFALQIVVTPLISLGLINGSLEEWVIRLSDVDPALLVKNIIWANIGANMVFSALLIWWSGHRIKKMTY